jgi:hypothetical protein
MKRLLTAALVAVALAGCGEDDGSEPQTRDITTEESPGALDESDFDRITIDGMPCIVWKDKRDSYESQYAYSGLTCDWRDR